MNGKFTADQKYQIVMKSFNSGIAVNDLSRRHGVSVAQFHRWKERFLEGGRTLENHKGEMNTRRRSTISSVLLVIRHMP
jgi:transposase-like protein